VIRRALLIAFAVIGLGAAAGYGWVQWRLRPVEAPPLEADWDAMVSVLAGNGQAGGRDGAAEDARFSDPFGVAASADGSVYVADAGDAQRIRRVAPDGTVSTIAGSAVGYADGPATRARFNTPSGLALDASGALLVADTGNNAIRRVAPDGSVSTLAGSTTPGFRDGPSGSAQFNGPIGIAVDGRGRVIVADTYNDRIRAINPDGTVTTIAGAGRQGWADGRAEEAQFDTPCGVAVDAASNIYVADTGNSAIRRISPDGVVTTIAPDSGLSATAIAAGADGVLYVAGGTRIVEIRPGAQARQVAGSRPGFADGRGADARFRATAGITIAAPGRLVVTDATNATVRLVAAVSQLGLRLPPAPRTAPAFDARAFSQAPLLWPFDPREGPFEITGTMGEARGGTNGQRFHAGLDVSGDEGMSVHALRDGVVASPVALAAFGTVSESIRVGPIAYVHLRVGRRRGSDPTDTSRFVASHDEHGKLLNVRVKRGARFAAGDFVGTLNTFNHAHLNIGWPGEEHNPLEFRLTHFEDTIPPVISRIRIVGEDGMPFTRRERGRLPIAGRVQVIVDAYDQADGNEARRRLGLYALGYQVLLSDGTPAPGFSAPRRTIEFDRLTSDESAANLVFADGSGIPFYGTRTTRFLYTVTNTFRHGVAAPGIWDTTVLPPGNYTLRILAQDFSGNDAIANRDVLVTIAHSISR
jgi:sugar lactone lactonase YvrE